MRDKNNNNPLTKDPKLGLTHIPTLVYYHNGNISRKLVEGQICNEEILQAFFEN